MTENVSILSPLSPQEGRLLSGGALAYLGDAVYELAVRRYLIAQGQTHPGKLHHLATHFVSAKAQAAAVLHLLETSFLSEEEEWFYKRGRNSSPQTKAKNTDASTYMYATGFEALIGYLDVTAQFDRLQEVLEATIQFLNQEKEASKR